jgi:SAM-dependent methyltransferase
MSNFFCPCCNGNFDEFLPFGVKQRPNARCPNCGSLERHRLLWLYFQNRTNLFSENLKVLHIAPEDIFQNAFKAMPNLDYISGDIKSSRAMVKMDITNIPYEANSFDVILCVHVLEHILDDRKAMRELFRVLKPNGWSILQVPIDLKRDKTFEDPSITMPEDRTRFFGQHDHVRVYGRDYRDRLEESGFLVTVDGYARDLGTDLIKKYSLKQHHEIYFCRKSKQNDV